MEGNVGIRVECLDIKSEGTGQIFLVNDNGSLPADSELQCIDGDGSELVEVGGQQFPIYDIGGQHFILDSDGHMQLLKTDGEGSVNLAESEEQTFQEEFQDAKFKYTVNEAMDLQDLPIEESSTEGFTQITLNEEQCRQLEEHGRILLQQDNRHYILDLGGLREVTGDLDAIEGFHDAVVSEHNMMLSDANGQPVEYLDMEEDISEDILTIPSAVGEPPQYSTLLHPVDVNIVNGVDIVRKEIHNQSNENMAVPKLELANQQNNSSSDEETIDEEMVYIKPLTGLPELNSEAATLEQLSQNERTKMSENQSNAGVKVDLIEDSDDEYIVTVSNMDDREENHGSVVPFDESILLKLPSKSTNAVARSSSRSLLCKNAAQSHFVKKETTPNHRTKVQNDPSKTRIETIDSNSLPPIMQKYLQAANSKKSSRPQAPKRPARKNVSLVKAAQNVTVPAEPPITESIAAPSIVRNHAFENVFCRKKEVEVFTSPYGISLVDETGTLKIKLTSKLPPGICDLKNKIIPIGPLKTGRRFFGKILSVVRPQNVVNCRIPALPGSPTRTDYSDDAMESLIGSVLLSSERECTGEDLAATESVLEELMKVQNVSKMLADRDVAVVKVLQKKKDGEVIMRDVHSAVCGRMGVFSDPTTDQHEWKFMYMPDLIKRRNCTDNQGVEEFEVTADGVPYRRVTGRGRVADAEGAPKSSQSLLQVRIVETTDEHDYKDTKIVVLEVTPGGRKKRLTKFATNDNSGKPYRCSTCAKTFPTVLLFAKHLSTEHMKKKSVACSHCKKTFDRPSNLQRHLRIHSDPPAHNDEESDRSNVPDASVDAQNADDAKRKVYKCDMCPCSYYFSSTLTRHIINAHILIGQDRSKPQASLFEGSAIACNCTVLPHPHRTNTYGHKKRITKNAVHS